MARTIAVDDKALEGSGDFTPIPDGAKLRVAIYDVEEVAVKSGTNAGKPQMNVTVKVVEDGPFKGREVKFNYIPLFAGAGNGWLLTAFADAVGWPIDRETKSVEAPDNLKEVLGTEVIAKFRQVKSQKLNEATGEPYINNNVNGYRKIKSTDGGAISDPAVKGWDSL